MTRHILPVITLALTLPAGAALAGNDCFVSRDKWQPIEAVVELARTNGWSVREIDIDDGCYEVEGRDANGHGFEAKLDPATLAIVKLETRPRAMGTAAPAVVPAPSGTTTP